MSIRDKLVRLPNWRNGCSCLMSSIPWFIVESNFQEGPLFEPEIQERLSCNPTCEALCMKILVACHLMGVWHPFVCNSVWWLAVKLWHSNQQSTTDQLTPTSAESNIYANALAWLEMHGLDISVYIQCRLKHS